MPESIDWAIGRITRDIHVNEQLEAIIRKLVIKGYTESVAEFEPTDRTAPSESDWSERLSQLVEFFDAGSRDMTRVLVGEVKVEGIDGRDPDALMAAALRFAGICPLWPFC